jgi:hypothetical protein
MAIRDERSGTDEILRDARFHRAALQGDPATEHLVERTAAAIEAMRTARAATDAREDARLDALAALVRADFELDDRCRTVELDVMAVVSKDRKSPVYRACFPRGLSDLVAGRGSAQAASVRTLVEALRSRVPDVAGRRADDLERLAAAAVAAETAWVEAERQSAATFAQERIARLELVRQLQKNEGALAEVYPGQRRRVRSFLRPTRRPPRVKAPTRRRHRRPERSKRTDSRAAPTPRRSARSESPGARRTRESARAERTHTRPPLTLRPRNAGPRPRAPTPRARTLRALGPPAPPHVRNAQPVDS